ncbi:UNVERIFIED_CONTAM: hypothetical protein Sindi_2250400 [Sesamum indicum]
MNCELFSQLVGAGEGLGFEFQNIGERVNYEGQWQGKDGIGSICEVVCDGGPSEGKDGNSEGHAHEMEGGVPVEGQAHENVQTGNPQSKYFQKENL